MILLGFINHAHAAFTDKTDNPVSSDNRTRGGSRSRQGPRVFRLFGERLAIGLSGYPNTGIHANFHHAARAGSGQRARLRQGAAALFASVWIACGHSACPFSCSVLPGESGSLRRSLPVWIQLLRSPRAATCGTSFACDVPPCARRPRTIPFAWPPRHNVWYRARGSET